MNLEYYKNFVAIVETGTISAASRALCIAQSALSTQIKILENEYGAQLLKRGARHIELTDAGQIFYEKAKTLCDLEDSTRKEIEDCVSGARGTLRIGFTPAPPDPFIYELLLNFREVYPQVNYEIHEANSDHAIQMLQEGTIEIGVIRFPSISPMIRVILAMNEQMTAVFHRNNPWLSPDLESIPLKLLDGIPLSMSKGFFHQKILVDCMVAGFKPNIFSICNSRAVALMWASRGSAVSIISSEPRADSPDNPMCYRPLQGSNMSTQRSFVVLKNKQLSITAQNFLDYVGTIRADCIEN